MISKVLGAIAALCWGGLVGFGLATLLTPADHLAWLIVCFTLGINATIWALVAGHISSRSRAETAARTAGRTGSARVDKISATNASVNDQTLYELALTVDAGAGSLFTASTRATIDPVLGTGPRVGDIVAVLILDLDEREVALDRDREAPPFRDDAVVAVDYAADSGGAPVRPQRRKKKRSWAAITAWWLLFAATAGVSYYVGAAPAPAEPDVVVTLDPIDDDATAAVPTPTPTPTPTPSPEAVDYVFDTDALMAALELAMADVPSDLVSEVTVHSHGVYVTAESAAHPGYYDDLYVRNGEVEQQGATAIQPEAEDLFDIWSVEWGLLPELYEQVMVDAPQILKDSSPSVHVAVSAPLTTWDEAADGPRPDWVTRMYVNNDYASARIEYTQTSVTTIRNSE